MATRRSSAIWVLDRLKSLMGSSADFLLAPDTCLSGSAADPSPVRKGPLYRSLARGLATSRFGDDWVLPHGESDGAGSPVVFFCGCSLRVWITTEKKFQRVAHRENVLSSSASTETNVWNRSLEVTGAPPPTKFNNSRLPGSRLLVLRVLFRATWGNATGKRAGCAASVEDETPAPDAAAARTPTVTSPKVLSQTSSRIRTGVERKEMRWVCGGRRDSVIKRLETEARDGGTRVAVPDLLGKAGAVTVSVEGCYPAFMNMKRLCDPFHDVHIPSCVRSVPGSHPE
ncbi:hypothetical protein BXZ70DRAFT_910527 [Cristinia sonorae]|uniref:Uncharacterized protein n=1 Tax=Cristinia sonorae TaxID=1940300 RepID=A0A8K0XKP8_9AGAR|nr:hypothetical protein BXZ70DRAFT_910527 [Cristinia sonorae]